MIVKQKKYYDEGVAKLLEATTAAPTDAPTEEPTETPTDVPPTEVDSTSGSGNASNACSQLEGPSNGSSLGKIGQVKFAWSEQPGAQVYVLTFVKEDGTTARIETGTNSAEFYIEVLPTGGNYQWFVTAYGSDGNAICTSTSNNFTKPQADPTEKPKPEDWEPRQPCDDDQCNSACPNYVGDDFYSDMCSYYPQ